MPAPASPRHRSLALWLCLVWLFGVEVGPGLHVALHAHLPGHSHGGARVAGAADELVVTVHTDGVHAHGGLTHRHDGGLDPSAGFALDPLPDDTVGSQRPVGPDHGAHSLAHRAMAIAAAPPPALHPLPIVRSVVPTCPHLARLVAIAPPPDDAARGPPIA